MVPKESREDLEFASDLQATMNALGLIHEDPDDPDAPSKVAARRQARLEEEDRRRQELDELLAASDPDLLDVW